MNAMVHNQLDTRKINSRQIQRKRKELEPYILQENTWNNNKSHKVHTQAKHKYNQITTHKQQTQTKPRHKTKTQTQQKHKWLFTNVYTYQPNN
jgi:hypothetical protein